MFSLLAFHAVAAQRGDGLHPKLLAALRRQEAPPRAEPPIMPFTALLPLRYFKESLGDFSDGLKDKPAASG